MSVTNNSENVITDIVRNAGNYLIDYKFIYCDTDEQWDTLVLIFKDNICVDVRFVFGID